MNDELRSEVRNLLIKLNQKIDYEKKLRNYYVESNDDGDVLENDDPLVRSSAIFEKYLRNNCPKCNSELELKINEYTITAQRRIISVHKICTNKKCIWSQVIYMDFGIQIEERNGKWYERKSGLNEEREEEEKSYRISTDAPLSLPPPGSPRFD